MRNLLKSTAAVAVLIGLSGGASWAMDLSSKTSDTQKLDMEINRSWKKTVDTKTTQAQKKSTNNSNGHETKSDSSAKRSSSRSASAGLDLTVSPDAEFLPLIKELERTGVEPFSSCQVLTHPKLPAAFGLSGNLPGGWQDTTRLEFISKAASSDSAITDIPGVDEAGVKHYRDCLAQYSAVIQQAYMQLQADISELDAPAKGSKKQVLKAGEIKEIRSLGFDDYRKLAAGALKDAVKTADLKKYDRWLTADPCRFEGKVEQIQCGSTSLRLTTRPELIDGALVIYGQTWGGVQATFKMSSSISLSSSLDALKSVSKYAKFASEMSDSAEQMDSQGRSKDAAYTRKKSLDKAITADQALSVAPFLKH